MEKNLVTKDKYNTNKQDYEIFDCKENDIDLDSIDKKQTKYTFNTFVTNINEKEFKDNRININLINNDFCCNSGIRNDKKALTVDDLNCSKFKYNNLRYKSKDKELLNIKNNKSISTNYSNYTSTYQTDNTFNSYFKNNSHNKMDSSEYISNKEINKKIFDFSCNKILEEEELNNSNDSKYLSSKRSKEYKTFNEMTNSVDFTEKFNNRITNTKNKSNKITNLIKSNNSSNLKFESKFTTNSNKDKKESNNEIKTCKNNPFSIEDIILKNICKNNENNKLNLRSICLPKEKNDIYNINNNTIESNYDNSVKKANNLISSNVSNCNSNTILNNKNSYLSPFLLKSKIEKKNLIYSCNNKRNNYLCNSSSTLTSNRHLFSNKNNNYYINSFNKSHLINSVETSNNKDLKDVVGDRFVISSLGNNLLNKFELVNQTEDDNNINNNNNTDSSQNKYTFKSNYHTNKPDLNINYSSNIKSQYDYFEDNEAYVCFSNKLKLNSFKNTNNDDNLNNVDDLNHISSNSNNLSFKKLSKRLIKSAIKENLFNNDVNNDNYLDFDKELEFTQSSVSNKNFNNNKSSLLEYSKVKNNENINDLNINNNTNSSSKLLSYQEDAILSLKKRNSTIKKSVKLNKKNISTNAYKVLECPGIIDDYYLNLLDWNKNNLLSVGIKDNVYLLNNSTSKILKLTYSNSNDCGSNTVGSVIFNSNIPEELAVGKYNGEADIWDLEKQKIIRSFKSHTQRVNAISWNSELGNSNLIATGSKDYNIYLRDLRSNEDFISVLSGHSHEVCGLKFNYEGGLLASGGNDNLLCIWDIKKISSVKYSSSFSKFSYFNEKMQSNSNMSKSFSNNTALAFKSDEHKAGVKALSWSKLNKNLLASGGGSHDQTIKLWNTDNYNLINSTFAGSQVCNLVFSESSLELISSHGYSQNQVNLWSIDSDINNILNNSQFYEYEKDKTNLEIKKYNYEHNKLLSPTATLTGHLTRVLYLALSPDGSSIATAAGDETLRFWEVFPKNDKNNNSIVNDFQSIGECIR